MDFHNTHTIQIENLEPNDSIEKEKTTKAMTVGMTTFCSSAFPLLTSDRGQIHLYNVDGKRIDPNEVFASIRARSHEEIIESWALKVSAVSLVILIIFQIIDWIIRYYNLF